MQPFSYNRTIKSTNGGRRTTVSQILDCLERNPVIAGGLIQTKAETPVPKDRMMDVIAALRCISINAPATIGDIVLEDVCGSRILVTKEVM